MHDTAKIPRCSKYRIVAILWLKRIFHKNYPTKALCDDIIAELYTTLPDLHTTIGSLNNDKLILYTTSGDLKDDILTLHTGFGDLNDDIPNLYTSFGDLNGGFLTLHTSFGNLNGDILTLYTSFGDLKDDFEALNGLKTVVNGL
jgi:hypothetical protein